MEINILIILWKNILNNISQLCKELLVIDHFYRKLDKKIMRIIFMLIKEIISIKTKI